MKRRKADVAASLAVATRGELESMARRIASLENSVASLQLSHNEIYQRAYRAGQSSIRKAAKLAAREVERLDANRYADAWQTIHPQELATINHAYDSR